VEIAIIASANAGVHTLRATVTQSTRSVLEGKGILTKSLFKLKSVCGCVCVSVLCRPNMGLVA